MLQNFHAKGMEWPLSTTKTKQLEYDFALENKTDLVILPWILFLTHLFGIITPCSSLSVYGI